MKKYWDKKFDYIIIGGGLSGCVIAARLFEANPNLEIAIVEAGPQATWNAALLQPVQYPQWHKTPLQYHYESSPQPQILNRKIPYWGSRVVAGSSALKYGAWTRGHAEDFDQWSRIVNDPRWSYNGLLPYFKKSEHWHEKGDTTQHGFSGPIHTSSGDLDFALCEPVRRALLSTGLPYNSDMNCGNPNGVARLVESWHKGSRQHAANCYYLEFIWISAERFVQRIFLKDGRAIGVELDNGKELGAAKEVIVCCGALRTPIILMLSGIGPQSELSKHGIDQVVDLPVGQNLHDHGSIDIVWELENPEAGYAVGSEAFDDILEYMTGNPMDWIASGPAPDEDLKKAAVVDGTEFQAGERTDFEVNVMYSTRAAAPVELAPEDGTHITTGVLCMSPTSRGTVTLASPSVTDNPIINPNYFATEHDRAVLRAGMRVALQAMESMEDHILHETPPPGMPHISSASSDSELDERINAVCGSWFHAGGTASMGKVVDSQCRVYGVDCLRVVDASIMPLPIAAHLQAPMYAIAELAADLILQGA